MGSRFTDIPEVPNPGGSSLGVEHVRSLLDTVEGGVVVASREGLVLIANERATLICVTTAMARNPH